MYAILETGGKQIKALVGQYIDIEKISGKVGDKVALKNVLILKSDKDLKIGSPYLNNVLVNGEIVEQGKKDKVIVYKMRPKKHYKRKQGHRQLFSRILIENIEQDGKIISSSEINVKKQIDKPKHESKPDEKQLSGKEKKISKN